MEAKAVLENRKVVAPKLRFKEFSQPWTKEKLGFKANSISSGKVKPEDVGDYLVYGSTGVIGKSNVCSHEGDYLLIARVGANAGRINRVRGKYSVTDNTLVVDLKNEIDIGFCEYFLIRFNLNKLIFGSGQPLITGGLLKSIDLIAPSLPEQQKIAAFLSAVDEKIRQLSRKKELLEQYKKGVMQQLFSGKLRFKDANGKDYPEWVDKELGEFIIKHEEKSTENNQYPVLTSSRNGMMFQKDYYDGNEVASKDNTGYNVVPRGYFTYRHMSDDLIFKFNINELCDKGIVSTLYPVFKTTKSLDPYFLRLKLNEGNEFREYAILQKQGGSRTYMYFNKLQKLTLLLPSLAEQKKIVACITSMEAKINHSEREINQTQTFKKGLLQQMFV